MDENLVDYMVVSHKPVYTLKECLECLDDETLYLTYFNHISAAEDFSDESLEPSREEMIKYLLDHLSNCFKDYLNEDDDAPFDVLDSFLADGSSKEECILLNDLNYIYGFKYRNKVSFVLPEPLLSIYREFCEDGSKEKRMKEIAENKITNLNNVVMVYLVINGFLSTSKLYELLELTGYDISPATYEKILDNFKHYRYGDILSLYGEDVPSKISENKNPSNYRVLNEFEVLDYMSMLNSWLCKFKKVFNEQQAAEILFSITTIPINLYDEEEFYKFMKVNKKQKEFCEKFISENHMNFRYAFLNGYTLEEYGCEEALKNSFLGEKPKNTSLSNCLKLLGKDELGNIRACYEEKLKGETSISALCAAIIDRASTFPLDEMEVEFLLDLENEETDYTLPPLFFMCGMAFTYNEDGEIKYLIPDEIKKILETRDYNVVYDYDEKDHIVYYLLVNGILEKDKLYELMHNDGFDITKSEINSMAKEIGASTYKNKYYALSDIPSNEAEDLIALKDLYGQYKQFDSESFELENDYDFESLKFIEDNFGLTGDDAGEISASAFFCIKNNVFQKEMFLDYMEHEGFLSKSDAKKFYDFAKKYKNKLGVWIFNGFSVLENSKMNVKKKVGRNEPCPCGSGKKYKQCCGK